MIVSFKDGKRERMICVGIIIIIDSSKKKKVSFTLGNFKYILGAI